MIKSALYSAIFLSGILSACSKSDSEDTKTSTSGDTLEAGVAGSYNVMSAQLGQLNIATYAQTGLRLQGPRLLDNDLSAVDWDDTIWSNTEVFNCFGECDVAGHSNTPAQFVGQALDKDRNSSPLQKVQEAVGVFCTLGVVFADEAGIPSAVTGKEVLVDAAFREKLATECGDDKGGDEEDFTATVDVEDISGAAFDRKITFKIDGEAAFVTYIRNDGTTINVGSLESYEEDGSTSVSRTMLSYDSSSKIFRFEYVNMQDGNSINTSLNFYRGFTDKNTNEIRFGAVMGSNYKVEDRWQNLSFLSVNGNGEEAQAGATMSRQDAYQSFVNKFDCFLTEDGSFVNFTGCTENSAENRKSDWSFESELFAKVAARGLNWTMGADSTIAAFTKDNMLSLEPNYD